MKPLSELLKQATAFDEPIRSQNKEKLLLLEGMRRENARLKPIFDLVGEVLDAVENIEKYADNLQKNYPDEMHHGSGESLLGQFTSQVSTDFYYVLDKLRQAIGGEK